MRILIERKRIKNLYVRVDNDGTIKVSAPNHIPDEVIFSFLEKKKGKLKWIIEKTKAKKLNCAPGSTIPYLGKQVTISVCKSGGKSVFFDKKRGILEISVENPLSILIEERVWEWYKAETLKLVKPFAFEFAGFLDKEIKRISVKRMKTRWGSCNAAKGYLNFNSALAQKRIEAIKYVVAHEVTHFVRPGHGKGFYEVVQTLYPGWKEGKRLLNQ